MLLEPFIKRKVFDILVVPVGVSYDRPLEEVIKMCKFKKCFVLLARVIRNFRFLDKCIRLVFGKCFKFDQFSESLCL